MNGASIFRKMWSHKRCTKTSLTNILTNAIFLNNRCTKSRKLLSRRVKKGDPVLERYTSGKTYSKPSPNWRNSEEKKRHPNLRDGKHCPPSVLQEASQDLLQSSKACSCASRNIIFTCPPVPPKRSEIVSNWYPFGTFFWAPKCRQMEVRNTV